MRARLLLRVALGVLLASSSGCIARTLPIPPPGVTGVYSDICDPTLCPEGGVIVTVRGIARAGALVIVENIDRRTPDGQRYTAAGYAVPESPVPTTDGGVPSGRFEIQLAPVRIGTNPPVVSRRGDHIVLYQFVRNEQGLWEQSETTMPPLVVP